jgi:hypothetical protein
MIELKESKHDKAFYRQRADEALAHYLRGGIKRRELYKDVIARLCDLAYQKGLRDGREEQRKKIL